MRVSRRTFFGAAAAAGAAAVTGAVSRVEAAATKATGLRSITSAAKPIAASEHDARLARLQALMQQRKVKALLWKQALRSSTSRGSAGRDPSEPLRR